MEQNDLVVLVIDDSSTVRKIMSDYLLKGGFAVHEADSIETALQFFAHADIAIAISDLIMPGVGGIAGISLIRQQWPLAGIIAMTAGSAQISSASLLNIARSAGAHKLLNKPFTEEQLLLMTADLVGEGFGTAQRRRKVIVVDDSATLRKLFSKVLEDNGYDCVCCDSAEQAIASPEILGIDCIVTDIFMPGKGGIQGIMEIKANWPTVPVIAMSGGNKDAVGADEALTTALKCGADATLQKPFPPQALLELLQRVISPHTVEV